MKRWVLIFFAFAFVAACGPLGDDDNDNDSTPHELNSGQYAESGFLVPVNECDYDFEPSDSVTVTVTETTVAVEDLVMDRTGNGLLAEMEQIEDLRPTFDCSVRLDWRVTGTIPPADSFSIEATLDTSVVSGTGCESVIGVSLPCHSEVRASYSLSLGS